MASLSEMYHGLEDKYYAFMDSLDDKGIPVYKVIDVLENNGIPSFPVFVLLILLVLAGIVWIAFSIISPPGTTSVTFFVKDSSGNDVSNATITAIIGERTETLTTKNDGSVSLNGVKIDDGIDLIVSKNGFLDLERTVTVTEENEIFNLTLSLEGEEPIIVRFNRSGTSELVSDFLTIDFTCSDNFRFDETQSTSTGEVSLLIPNDCGILYASVRNFVCENNCAVSADEDNIVFYLSKTIEEKGSIIVTVTDGEQNLLSGIEVRAILEDEYTASEECETTTLGACELNDLAFGNYYITAYDRSGKFSYFNSSNIVPQEFVQISSDNLNLDFDISLLQVGGNFKISLKILDEANNSIENAKVSLLLENVEIDSNYSNDLGIVSFFVEQGKTFSASIEHSNFLRKNIDDLMASDRIREITLTRVSQENVNRIPVQVSDEKGFPVENVRLYLRDSSSLNNVGDLIVTGIDGKAQFERVEAGSYIVFAEKPGFEPKTSSIITVRENIPVSEVSIVMNIGFGTIQLQVMNEDNAPVSGAIINVTDFCNNQELNDLTSSTLSDGSRDVKVRVDKCVFFKVSAPGYLNYSTNVIQPVKDVTIEKKIILVRGVDALKATFELFSGNELVSGTSLERGKRYTAKISLLVPDGTSFDEVGLHFRTGAASNGLTNILEKDSLYISSVQASNAKIVKGTSFTPPRGYDIDSQKLTSGNAKWFNASFSNPSAGVYEIVANIQVTQNATSGSLLDVWNRVWAKQGGNYSRNPVDGVLGGSESTSAKQALYANASRNVYTVGSSSLCNDGFCHTFTVTDSETNLTQSIVDSLPVKINNVYFLSFALINNSSIADGAEISFSHNSNGLKISDYEITNVDSQRLNGTVLRNSQTVQVGDMLVGSTVLGRIGFTSLKEGINSLEFKLNASSSGGKQTVFSRNFKFTVPPSQNMNLEVLPTVIVPFIENELLIKASTGAGIGLDNATIIIKKNNEKIVIGKTNNDGVFAFSLEAVREGTRIEIIAEKNGYRTQNKTINVQQEIVTVIPSTINETFKANVDQTISRDIQLRNLTDLPLEIGLLDFSSDFDDLVDLRFEEDYIGRDIVKEIEDRLILSMKLSPKGRNVSQVTTVNGTLNIHFVSRQLQRTWVSSIPITLTIGLGKELDFAECLQADQESISFASAGGSVQKTLLLSNNCTVEGQPVELKNVQARVKLGAANEIGSIVLRSSIEEDTLILADESIDFASNISLDEKFKTIADAFGKSAESILVLTFNPDDLESASSEVFLEIRAHNPTANGTQIISSKTSLNLAANDLLSCVKVNQRAPLLLQLNPANAGFGLYNSQFGYNPLGGYGAFGSSVAPSYGSVYNNPNVVFPNQSGNYQNYYQGLQYRNFPSTAYNYPFQAQGYTDPRYNQQFSPNIANTEARFNVENSCTLPIEVRIDANPALNTEPTGMDLNPNQNQDVKVKSTYLIGQYNIDVKAKVKNSTDAQVIIDSLNATIEPNDFYRNWRDCITLDKRTYQFNDLIAKPVEGTITNTCYSSGVILDPVNPVEFDLQNIVTGTSDNVFTENLIQRTEVIDRTVRPGPDGKVIEQVRFRLRKSLDYRTTIKQNQLPTSTNPLVEIFNWRVALTGAYYTVKAPQYAIINFTTRTGQTQRLLYDVIIEDWWNIAGLVNVDIDLDSQLGSQTPTFDCLRDIDFGRITEKKFKNNVFEWEANPSVMIIDKEHCGSSDRLKNLSPRTWQDPNTGLIIEFRLVDKDHNVKLKFDISEMTEPEARITPRNLTLDADLYRYRLSRSKSVGIGVRGTVDIGKLGEIDPKVRERVMERARDKAEEGILREQAQPELEDEFEEEIDDGKISREQIALIVAQVYGEFSTCNELGFEGGGIAEFEEFGFDKLAFSWDWQDFEFNSCDAVIDAEETKQLDGKFFCDAAQYSITLNKKAKEIQSFIKTNTDNGTFKDDTTENKKEEDFRNTDNLWRHTKPQVQIIDNTNEKKLVFFIKNNKIVENDKLKRESVDTEVGSLLNLFPNLSSPEIVNAIVNDMQSLLNEIENKGLARSGNDIIAEIDGSGIEWGSQEIVKLEFIGAKKETQLGGKYVLTFKEFKRFHNAIKDNNECESDNCIITLDGLPNVINVKFMQALYSSIEFKVGLRNIDGLSKEEIALAEALPDAVKIQWPSGINNYESFKKNFLEFDSFFILDGYTNNFKEDFKNTYVNDPSEELIGEFGTLTNSDWDIQTIGGNQGDIPLKIIQPGKRYVKLNFNWQKSLDNPKVKVVIDSDDSSNAKRLKDISDSFAENYFFYLPLDGEVGKKGSINRYGYGTAFYQADEASDIFFNEKTKGFTINRIFNPKPVKSFTAGATDYSFEKFEKTRTGIVLDIEEDEKFHYYPSIPVGIVTQITGSAGNDAVFYKLTNGEEVALDEGLDYIFEWKGSSFTGQPIKDTKESLDAFCSGNTGKEFGFITNVSTGSSEVFGTIAFLPHTKIYKLNLICSKEKTTTIVKEYASGKNPNQATQTNTSGSLEPKTLELLYSPAEAPKDRNIREYVDGIRKGEICFDSSDEHIKLKWNETFVMDGLQIFERLE